MDQSFTLFSFKVSSFIERITTLSVGANLPCKWWLLKTRSTAFFLWHQMVSILLSGWYSILYSRYDADKKPFIVIDFENKMQEAW